MNRKFSVLVTMFLSISAYSQTIDETGGVSVPIREDATLYFQVVPINDAGDSRIDALFALSEGPVTGYSDCSAILRFNNTQAVPYLDVYDGGYTRTNNVAISFNAPYHCWLVIHFADQTYDTYVLTDAMESPVLVHEAATFRKTAVGSLSHWSSIHFAGTTSNVLDVQNVGFVETVGDKAPDWLLLGTEFGELDEAGKRVSNIPPDVTISGFAGGLTYTESATIEILDGSGTPLALTSDQLLTSEMTLKIAGMESSEYTLEVREQSASNQVLSAFNGSINHTGETISGLYNDLTLIQFRSGIKVSPYATFKVLDAAGEEATSHQTLISGDHKVEVTAENGAVKTYTIATGSDGMPATVTANTTATFHRVTLEKLDLEGNIEWHIKSADNPLPGSLLNIKSDEVWIYFDHIRPQRFFDHYLDQIRVHGAMPQVDVNLRLVQYGNGCVIIGHPDTYIPLTVYADAHLSGTSKEVELYAYHKTASLGVLADNIESFVLKKGYMATFAEDIGGTGNSQVFIAYDEDIVVNEMPAGLSNTVSFVRVVPWRWTTKKSFADGSYEKNEILNSSWRYNWDNSASSSLNIEYVPMRHNPNWPAYSNMVGKQNVTHALHFNEPDNPVDDGYSTVEEALAQWPQMLATGLRLGTPAPTDGGTGWLYDFVDACAANNYRVDFVAVHFYRGGQSTAQFYNFLKSIHDRTGLPIWVTEWNNGANWTCCKPTYESQVETISDWVDMLEAAPFVERYALYGRVEDTRQMFYSGTTDLTPAGRVYRDKASTLAYNPNANTAKHFYPSNEAKEVTLHTVLSWNPSASTTAQQLYFGESFPPEFRAHLDGKTSQYDPGELEYNKTYYWRVDEYNGTSYVTGDSLEFTTISFIKPYDPHPAMGATDVAHALTLAWISDTLKPEIHRLYFGEDPSAIAFRALLPDTLTQFDPGKLDPNKTYYWRVDEHLRLKSGEEIITEGDVWSFTTTSVTGMDSKKLPAFRVYPVPVAETVCLQGLKGAEEVTVYNMLGAKVLSGRTSNILYLEHLPKGIYLIKVEGYEPVKIIK